MTFGRGRRAGGAIRLEIPDRAPLEPLIAGRLPLGLGTPAAVRESHRDAYYDTPDAALLDRGIECRIRYAADGRQTLDVSWSGAGGASGHHEDVAVSAVDPRELFSGPSAAAAMLRSTVDPARLIPVLEIQTDRHVRTARWTRWLSPCCRIAVDRSTIVARERRAEIAALEITPLEGPGPSPARLASALIDTRGVRPARAGGLRRAREALDRIDADSLASAIHAPRECAVLLVRDREIGLRRLDSDLGVFWMPGSGESACREILEQAFGTSQAQVRCLGQAGARPWRPPLEVWMARRLPEAATSDPSVEWIDPARAVELAGGPMLRDARTLAALHIASRSDVMREHTHGVTSPRTLVAPLPRASGRGEGTAYLDGDISQLEFNARVLELAADPAIAVGDRLAYLAIAAANLDEFVMVRIAALKQEQQRDAPRPAEAGAPSARLDAVRLRARALSQRMSECLQQSLLPELASRGIRIRAWADLDADEQARLSRRFHDEVRPRLVPLALTANHPFPHIGSIELALAVMLRHADTGHTHYATVSLPSSLPRFLPLDAPGAWIPLEAVVCAHTASLFPGVEVLRAHTFRVIRSGDADYDDVGSTDLLQQVADVVERRRFQPVVWVEVERRMPPDMRALLLQEFRFELPDRVSDLEESDVVEFDALAALRGLREIASTISCRVPVRARAPFGQAPVFDTVRAHDVLAHFPYDSFDASVQRFLDEAADDPGVEAITLALYRTSADSPIIDALYRARAAGKTVVALVELKARFDEARNIETARALRAVGVHVVYGIAEMKLHSKIILVLRREADGLRRYAYVGSGNFNPVTAGLYTDVGLFTSRRAIGDELAALADSLTGLASAPAFENLLLSPATMLPRLMAMIRLEIGHAAAGRPAGIRLKLNGLDDGEMIDALYAASKAGVPVDLSIRGICRLRPGVPGLSENIRVVSVLGEFLEHARILEFTNGGAPEYFIGSADWRARNLRRRVEVMVPVVDGTSRLRLARLLEIELNDPAAWVLGADGAWVRRPGSADAQTAQRQLLGELLPVASGINPDRDRSLRSPMHNQRGGNTPAPVSIPETPDAGSQS